MTISLTSPVDSHYWKTSIPLSRGILNAPAEFALRLLLSSRVGSLSSLGLPEHLSDDASRVRDACKALQQCMHQDNTVDSSMIDATAQTLVETLSDDTLLKLSLITWHFDGSTHFDTSSYAPSPALARFLEQPNDDTIWETLYGQYQSRTGVRVSLRRFKDSHDFLLYPTLCRYSNEA